LHSKTVTTEFKEKLLIGLVLKNIERNLWVSRNQCWETLIDRERWEKSKSRNPIF
jgi:hypothetical protein